MITADRFFAASLEFGDGPAIIGAIPNTEPPVRWTARLRQDGKVIVIADEFFIEIAIESGRYRVGFDAGTYGLLGAAIDRAVELLGRDTATRRRPDTET